MRLVSALAIVQLCGCNFAVKHPAATAAIAGAGLGFGTCELEVAKPATCGIVGGATGAFLGIVAGIAMWTMGGDAEDHVLYDPLLPGDGTVQAGEATDGSPDGTQIDSIPEPPPEKKPALIVVPAEKQTPIPRLVLPPPGEGSGSGSGSATPTP